MSRVGLVLVSHSAKLAAGLAELAGQMAPDVTLIPVGGTADGGLGTDFDAVAAALETAAQGLGVVVLYDLGSAKMIADLAVESLAEGQVRVVDAPLVEGVVAAAVAAQGGADLAAVANAATDAVNAALSALGALSAAFTADIPLVNEIGLHARPAALLARSVAELDAQVTVAFGGKQANAASVLAVMALGARGGDTVTISATGPAAAEALQRIRDLAGRGFDD